MTQINNNKEVQYIWHDGVRIREDQLISMAKRAGSYALAEHYMCSLLAHGTAYGLAYIIDKANEIREFYQVGAIPKPNIDDDSMLPKPENAIARKRYVMMELEERKEIIKLSLEVLIKNYQNLFKSKNDWIGIYLVIRDRVNGNLSMADFYNNAHKTMAKCWPEHLMIGRYTMGNFSRCIDYEDRQEAYFDMEHNPWKMLCSVYWEILKQQILTNK